MYLLIIQERVEISQIFQRIWIQQVKSNFLSKKKKSTYFCVNVWVATNL
jgi:hypothetical protein